MVFLGEIALERYPRNPAISLERQAAGLKPDPEADNSGQHAPANWVRLLLRCQNSRFSGVLRLRHNALATRAYFFKGQLLEVRNDAGENGQADKPPVDPTGPPDLSTLARGLARGLQWPTGEWELASSPALRSVEISRDMAPPFDLWETLLNAVQEHMDARSLKNWAMEHGRVFQACEENPMPAWAATIGEKTQGGQSLSNLQGLLDHEEGLPAQLWLLSAAGCLREGLSRQPATQPVETPAPPSRQQPTLNMDDCPEDPMQALVWEYDQRMDQDYYGFLGLPRDATLKDLAEDGRKLAQRLTTLSRIDDLPQPVQKRVQEMLTAVHLVFATLTDTRRKEEYDALLDDGQAPQITSQPQEPLAAADAHITRAHQSFRGPPAEPARGWRFWRKDGQE